jgi:hypothetical protein
VLLQSNKLQPIKPEEPLLEFSACLARWLFGIQQQREEHKAKKEMCKGGVRERYKKRKYIA